MPGLTIRLATALDAEAIALDSMSEIEHDLTWRWTPGRIVAAIDDPETNVAVAFEEGAMLGFGVMHYDDDVAHLQLFAVRENVRRRGIGSALLVWLERVARVAGVTTLKVESRLNNRPALAFYRKHGYLEVEAVRGMYDGSDDGVRLEKTISTAAKQA